jgi:hypothetical protein
LKAYKLRVDARLYLGNTDYKLYDEGLRLPSNSPIIQIRYLNKIIEKFKDDRENDMNIS